MADALRATKGVPGFAAAAKLHFIEPSPVLKENLSERFNTLSPVFLDQLEEIPTDKPILVVANEWLDCLPVQQYARAGETWHERVIGLDEAGALAFGLNADALPPEISPDGSLASLELQPGLKTLSEA